MDQLSLSYPFFFSMLDLHWTRFGWNPKLNWRYPKLNWRCLGEEIENHPGKVDKISSPGLKRTEFSVNF